MAGLSLTLVIGDKNVSSWSLRPWLLLKQFGIPFEEVRITLRRKETREQIVALGGQTVPVLKDGGATLWESLAIAEHLAERFPEKAMWPGDLAARAFARSVTAEMHAGFSALRSECSMNILARMEHFAPTLAAARDIARIDEIWRTARGRFGAGGDFLFGKFSIADAFYAPVVTRFRTYGIDLPGPAKSYCAAILALPAMREWENGAREEVGG